jgi:DNA-binding NtrC family response regulator
MSNPKQQLLPEIHEPPPLAPAPAAVGAPWNKEELTGQAALTLCVDTLVRMGVHWKDAERMFRRGFAITALEQNGNSQTAAARAIRVHRNTLRRLAGLE